MEHLEASTCPIPYSGEAWSDRLEEAVQCQIRAFIEAPVLRKDPFADLP